MLKKLKLNVINDKQGQPYLEASVSEELLKPFIKKFESIVKDFKLLQDNKFARDGQGKYHMTVLVSSEFKRVIDIKDLPKEVDVTLRGLGSAKNKDSITWFVVCDSIECNELRLKLGLAPKDFHVTLGFNPKDVHGVHKNIVEYTI